MRLALLACQVRSVSHGNHDLQNLKEGAHTFILYSTNMKQAEFDVLDMKQYITPYWVWVHNAWRFNADIFFDVVGI